MAKELPLVRDFVILLETITVAEACERVPKGSYAVIVDSQGTSCGCLYELARTTRLWPGDQLLAALKARWQAPTLPEAEAIGLGEIARFFRDELDSAFDAAGVVLLDHEGRPSAVLPRGRLEAELSTSRGADPVPKGLGETVPVTEDALMVTRYGRLQFPAQVALDQRCWLTISINRELAPGEAGQVELGLRSKRWPVKVLVTLVNVLPEDFEVLGPASDVILVPRQADSDRLTFTLVPKRLGPKEILVSFMQCGKYLGMASIKTDVIQGLAGEAAQAQVDHAPTLATLGPPPDFTILVKRLRDQSYTVSVYSCDGQEGTQPRQVDQFTFEDEPKVYMAARYDELSCAAPAGAAQQFDEVAERIGNNLYDKLFQSEEFKSFFWNQMYPMSDSMLLRRGAMERYVPSVQIISDEPYIPWELVRPYRRLENGNIETDPMYFCERFALSRWLAPGQKAADALPLHKMALVIPPSNLPHVADESSALQALARQRGLQVEIITERQRLMDLLQGTDEVEVLHFACHGKLDQQEADQSFVLLGTERWAPDDLTGKWLGFGRFKPLVFLNACETGQLGVGLTGIDGWASRFVSVAQVGFFIGSTWKANDELAYQFAHAFYSNLFAGLPVAEAMRKAREGVKRAGQATHLSYTLYANPQARVQE